MIHALIEVDLFLKEKLKGKKLRRKKLQSSGRRFYHKDRGLKETLKRQG